MKKSLLSLMGIVAVSAMVYGTVNAQSEISELFNNWTPLVEDAYTRLLNDYDSSRWYSSTATVTCEANNGINISSQIVEDAAMDGVNIYNLFLSPYRMDQLKSGDPTIDTSKVIIKKVEINEWAESVDFNISDSDVDSNTTYYGFISPVDLFDVVGTPSKEICFQLSNNVCLQDSACDSIGALKPTWWDDVEEMHGASCVWMDLANVTHTIKWDTITLKWTAVDGDDVQIAILDPKSEVYKNLWTVKMSDEKFDYKMQWSWEQNFVLVNGCGEYKYKADRIEGSEPEKIVTPATGPAENILYVAIAAIVLYGAYVLFFRKSDNK